MFNLLSLKTCMICTSSVLVDILREAKIYRVTLYAIALRISQTMRNNAHATHVTQI